MGLKVEINDEKSSDNSSKNKQYIATICVSLGAVCAGSVLAWTSPVLPQLTQPQSNATNTTNTTNTTTFSLTDSEAALVGALLPIGALISALPAGLIADRIGRRRTLLSLVVPFLLNWACIVWSGGSVVMLCVGRFWAGVATAVMCVCAPMYIGEIAESEVRGRLGSCFQMFLCAGVLLTYFLGAFLDWIQLSYALATLPILYGIAFYFMPETPIYLLKSARGREHAARSLRYLRDPRTDITAELDLILADVTQQNPDKTSTVKQSFCQRLSVILSSTANRRSLTAGLGVMIFQQLSGINAVIFYTGSIFEAAGSSLPSSQASIVIGVVQLIAAYVSVVVIEKFNRRFFLTLSSAGMLVCLLCLGLYFHAQIAHVSFPGLGMVPLISLVLFIMSFSFGFGPIPWLLMSELYPAEIKGAAAGVAILLNWACAFVVTWGFPIMQTAAGPHVTFYMFALINGVAVLFVRYCIPETRGKSLTEIQTMLSR